MRRIMCQGLLASMYFLAACTTIDPNSAKALGAAGQTAAQALAEQTESGRKIVDSLPEWWGVHDALICSTTSLGDARTTCLKNVFEHPHPEPALLKAQTELSQIISKRVVAAIALRDAYQAFSNLAMYDAGGETEQAIKSAFGSINKLTEAAAAIAPQGVALAAISSTFTNTASGLGKFIASKRQQQLMYDASLDLHKATEALTKALTVERDSQAIKSLLSMGQVESDQLYLGFVRSGLVTPKDALAPLFSQIAPDGQLVQSPPASNLDVIGAAASISIAARSKRKQIAIVRSYDSAVAGLHALAAEHMKLEQQDPLNLAAVLAEVKNVQTLLADLRSTR